MESENGKVGTLKKWSEKKIPARKVISHVWSSGQVLALLGKPQRKFLQPELRALLCDMFQQNKQWCVGSVRITLIHPMYGPSIAALAEACPPAQRFPVYYLRSLQTLTLSATVCGSVSLYIGKRWPQILADAKAQFLKSISVCESVCVCGCVRVPIRVCGCFHVGMCDTLFSFIQPFSQWTFRYSKAFVVPLSVWL